MFWATLVFFVWFAPCSPISYPLSLVSLLALKFSSLFGAVCSLCSQVFSIGLLPYIKFFKFVPCSLFFRVACSLFWKTLDLFERFAPGSEIALSFSSHLLLVLRFPVSFERFAPCSQIFIFYRAVCAFFSKSLVVFERFAPCSLSSNSLVSFRRFAPCSQFLYVAPLERLAPCCFTGLFQAVSCLISNSLVFFERFVALFERFAPFHNFSSFFRASWSRFLNFLVSFQRSAPCS